MFAQKNIYQLAVTGALLLAGCTSDDVAFEAAPAGSVPLSFTCTSDDGFSEDGQEGTRAVLGYQGPMDSEDLRHTGFGVFASQSGSLPDMMHNQEVKFTYIGDKDDPLKGFWSYQPTKYWPSDLTHFYIGAYAPYQDPVAVDSDEPGIIGISENSHEPYIEFRRSLKPEDCVDLLWYFGQPSTVPAATADHEAGTLAMKMGHALARIEVNAKLANDDLPADTKVLIESIEIIGSMVKEGRLMLDGQITKTETVNKVEVTKYYPKWSVIATEEDRTIVIDNDDDNTNSYGIIDANVRYVKGLPYKWQPDGLSTTPQNALSDLDRKTYIYLIPQAEAEGSETPSSTLLTAKVRYHKMTATEDIPYYKGSNTKSIVLANPLRGNTTYTLNIIIDL